MWTVKNLSAIRETWIPSLDPEDPLEMGMASHSSSCLENSMDRGVWQATVHGVTESDTTEAMQQSPNKQHNHSLCHSKRQPFGALGEQ